MSLIENIKAITIGDIISFLTKYGAFIVACAVFIGTVGKPYAEGFIDSTVEGKFKRLEGVVAEQSQAIEDLERLIQQQSSDTRIILQRLGETKLSQPPVIEQ
jgi:cell division protein FtsL